MIKKKKNLLLIIAVFICTGVYISIKKQPVIQELVDFSSLKECKRPFVDKVNSAPFVFSGEVINLILKEQIAVIRVKKAYKTTSQWTPNSWEIANPSILIPTYVANLERPKKVINEIGEKFLFLADLKYNAPNFALYDRSNCNSQYNLENFSEGSPIIQEMLQATTR